ncbi:MAG: pilus assembly protein [Pararhodobacter sp.]|nr:pilus assembly protein [Pararhodobacter sp.]
MKLIETFKNFHNDESGAVTVDWVVLTAAIVGLGIAVVASVRGGVTSLGSEIGDALTAGSVTDIPNFE